MSLMPAIEWQHRQVLSSGVMRGGDLEWKQPSNNCNNSTPTVRGLEPSPGEMDQGSTDRSSALIWENFNVS